MNNCQRMFHTLVIDIKFITLFTVSVKLLTVSFSSGLCYHNLILKYFTNKTMNTNSHGKDRKVPTPEPGLVPEPEHVCVYVEVEEDVWQCDCGATI